MAELVELQRGVWLDDSLDEETGQEVDALCRVMEMCVTDAVLCLSLFEQASVAAYRSAFGAGEWDRDRALERARQEELEAREPPVPLGGDGYGERRTRLYTQAQGDVVRAKWEAGELPRMYAHRLPFLYARTFMTSLAQLGRSMDAMAKLGTGDAKAQIVAARDQFKAALPRLTPIRDSIEHAEDRMRGLDKNANKLTLAPVSNQLIDAPGGGVLLSDTLNDRHYGCTVEDGTYAEVEVADETLEVARSAVQAIFDALPWRPGPRQFSPLN